MDDVVRLRVVAAISGVAIGLPFLVLAGAADGLRDSAIPLKAAPMIYLVIVAAAVVSFVALHANRASGRSFAAVGAALGLVPGLICLFANALELVMVPMLTMLAVGCVSGGVAGWLVWYGDDGFAPRN